MDLLSAATAAGLRSRTEALELLANNIANAQTTGYKADRELYSKYQTGEAWEAHTKAEWQEIGVLPDIDNHWTDFQQGPLQVTGNSLDLALEGPGFFVVEGPGGQAPNAQGGPGMQGPSMQGPGAPGNRLMTRDGHFRLSPRGRLETTDGYAVLGVRNETQTNGARQVEPIQLDPRQPVEIAPDGTIRQQGAIAGRLLLAFPANPQLLPKRSGNYFSLDPSYLQPPAAATAKQMAVHQGKLEGANFSPAEAAVRLVNVMRQFETLQRALQLGGEMNRRAVEDVARVS